jgi:hypothetical protein
VDFKVVRKIGVALPGVEVGTAYGSPALKVRGKLLTCLAVHKSAEPGTLVVSIGFDERAQLMAADPETYYLKDHYLPYPVVLVRLARIEPDALRELLKLAWKFVAERPPKRRKKSSPVETRRRRTSLS